MHTWSSAPIIKIMCMDCLNLCLSSGEHQVTNIQHLHLDEKENRNGGREREREGRERQRGRGEGGEGEWRERNRLSLTQPRVYETSRV